MRTRIFCLAPAMVDVYVRTYHLQTIPVYACVHAYTYTPSSMAQLSAACRSAYACVIGSNAINRVSHAPSARVRLAYTVYARARTRLSACACAGYAYSYAPAQMTERTYIYPENRSRFILPRANALGNYTTLFCAVTVFTSEMLDIGGRA